MKFLRKFDLTIFGLAILINFVYGMKLPVNDIGDDSMNNEIENSDRFGLGLNVDLGVVDVGVGIHLGSESVEDSAVEETQATVVETQAVVVQQQVEETKEMEDSERLGVDLGLGVHLRSQSIENIETETSNSNSVEQYVADSGRVGIDLGLDVHLRTQSKENSETERSQENSAEQHTQSSESMETAKTEVMQTTALFAGNENTELILQAVLSETSEVPIELISSAEATPDSETYEVLGTVDAETTEALETVITEISETAPETTTNAAAVESTTLGPICYAPGLLPHETDCHLYYSCSLQNSPDGILRLQTLSCANNEAFNVRWGRCARELSACPNQVTCIAPGSLADPLGNTSYYLCYPRQTAEGGYLIYHVQCKTGEVFLPALGKCFLDLSDFTHAYMSYNWTEVHDLTVVTAEYKQYRMEEKLLIKMEKEKAKLQKKLQKELEKLAKQRAKEEAKGQKAVLYQ